jgi:hypothetical protein
MLLCLITISSQTNQRTWMKSSLKIFNLNKIHTKFSPLTLSLTSTTRNRVLYCKEHRLCPQSSSRPTKHQAATVLWAICWVETKVRGETNLLTLHTLLTYWRRTNNQTTRSVVPCAASLCRRRRRTYLLAPPLRWWMCHAPGAGVGCGW